MVEELQLRVTVASLASQIDAMLKSKRQEADRELRERVSHIAAVEEAPDLGPIVAHTGADVAHSAPHPPATALLATGTDHQSQPIMTVEVPARSDKPFASKDAPPAERKLSYTLSGLMACCTDDSPGDTVAARSEPGEPYTPSSTQSEASPYALAEGKGEGGGGEKAEANESAMSSAEPPFIPVESTTSFVPSEVAITDTDPPLGDVNAQPMHEAVEVAVPTSSDAEPTVSTAPTAARNDTINTAVEEEYVSPTPTPAGAGVELQQELEKIDQEARVARRAFESRIRKLINIQVY